MVFIMIFGPNIDRMEKEKNIQGLIQLFRSRNRNVQKHATDALVKIGKPAVDPLLKVLNDANWAIRINAITTLADMKEQRVVEPCIRALNDNHYGVRGVAAITLGELGDRRAVMPLIQSLNDEHPYIRREAALALGHLEDGSAIEPLNRILDDKYSDVQDAAKLALKQIKISKIKGDKPIILCPKCGHKLKGKPIFCSQCGNKVNEIIKEGSKRKKKAKYCSNCGVSLAEGSKLCHNCGKAIMQKSPDEEDHSERVPSGVSEESRFVGSWKNKRSKEILTFYSNGTCNIPEGRKTTHRGTYEIKDERLVMTVEGNLLKYDYSFSNNYNTLVTKSFQSGDIDTWIRRT